MRKVKDLMGETKDKEPLVTYKSVINQPRYLKLFECGKKLLNNLDATYEQACMANFQGKCDTSKLRYGQACMLYKKGNYYMEISNTIINFNKNNNMPLSNVNI